MDYIHEEVARQLKVEAEAAEAATRQMILDAMSGWHALHTEVGGECVDIFSKVSCNIDPWAVTRVARYG
jgi:hypothetical protein